MFKIKNRFDQPLVINLGDAKVLHLMAGSAAVIPDDALQAAQVQGLIASGALEYASIQEKRPTRRRKDERASRKREG